MDILTETDSDGDIVWTDKQILSTELKQLAGFGKGGEKNFPGITTDLMMKTYLITADFHRRRNKKGAEYGMAVSVLMQFGDMTASLQLIMRLRKSRGRG